MLRAGTRRKESLAACLTALALLVNGGSGSPGTEASARVRRVLDGDSVVLDDGKQVRYLGINTPEVGEPFSDEARRLNRNLVEGKPVRLVSEGRPRDRYGRILAYVYADGVFVNAQLVQAGLAHLLIFRSLGAEPRLAALEREARRAGRGMWTAPGPQGPLKITSPRARHGRGDASSALGAVTICNISGASLEVGGFVLESDHGRLRLPRARLAPGHVAIIFRKAGRNLLGRVGPLLLHWPGIAGSNRWPSTLILRDPENAIIDRVRFAAP